MSGLIKSNLEPIEESDMDLDGKLRIGENKKNFSSDNKKEDIFLAEKDIDTEIIGAEKDSAYVSTLSKVQLANDGNDATDDAITIDANNTLKKIDAESQIKHLIDVAQQKGVVYAVKVAKHMQDNYVLDLFHDKLLSDELHSALINKGIIKEI